MPRKMHRNSLANLDPRNRYQGKERFNTTLLPETIAWLQQSGNASRKIEELVEQAQSEHAQEPNISFNTHEQNSENDSYHAHELKELTDRLYQAEETLNSVAGIVRRWEAEASSRKTSNPRWEKVIKLLAELHTELQSPWLELRL